MKNLSVSQLQDVGCCYQTIFKGHDRDNHLTTMVAHIPAKGSARCQQIDALMGIVVWFSIVPNLQPSFNTCCAI